MPRTPLRTLVLLLASLSAACASSSSQRFALDDPGRLAQVFAEVHSAVVTLRTFETAPSVASGGAPAAFEGVGTGTVIDAEGHILTAAHVVQTSEALFVDFFDGSVRSARVLASDPVADLSLLRIEGELPESVRPVVLGDSAADPIGSRVFVVGAPRGVSHTLTQGILSARRRAPSLVAQWAEVEVLQTDAAINPGNSGGPLFNLRGEQIGVVSYIITESGGSEGLGFAVPTSVVRARLLERHPLWSGMSWVPAADELAGALNLPPGRDGLLVQRISRISPAAELGLRGGSMVAVIDGQAMLLGGDVILAVQGIPSEVRNGRRIEVLRGGELVELSAPLSALR